MLCFEIMEHIKTNRRLPTKIKHKVQLKLETKDVYIVFTSPSAVFVYNFPFEKPNIQIISPSFELLKELKKFKLGRIYVVPYVFSTLVLDDGVRYVVFKRLDVFKNTRYKYVEIDYDLNFKKIVKKMEWKEVDKLLKIKTVETMSRIISNSIKVYRN